MNGNKNEGDGFIPGILVESKTTTIQKIKDYISIILVSLFVGILIGSLLAYKVICSGIDETLLLGRFLYKGQIYEVSKSVDRRLETK